MLYRATHTTRYRYERHGLAVSERGAADAARAAVADAARVAHRDHARAGVGGSGTRTTSATRSPRSRSSRATTASRPWPRAWWTWSRGPRPAGDLPWEAVRDELALHERPETLEAFEFVFDSPFVAAGAELADYARPSFTPGRAAASRRSTTCRTASTPTSATSRRPPRIDTPLLEALAARRGVCQDFSHVMIGALRSLGLAARYVSGYLRSGADYQGAEASHAWVSVFVPGSGWMDIDPTNDVRPGTGHVTLAWGRDYGDVTPVKGIALGGGHQVVEVEVRVEPIDAARPANS